MSSDDKFTIMDQDLAAAAIGLRTFFPSFRHIVFARSHEPAPQLVARFLNAFGTELKEDYFTKRISQRLGVTVLSFSDESGRIKTSNDVVEVTDLSQARIAVPEISAASSLPSPGHRPIR
jgi:hypothetical protein